eukprot:scaffold10084_cov139-Isochrysis_galbana.AAC.6
MSCSYAAAPSTCSVVLSVSSGVMARRHADAAALAQAVRSPSVSGEAASRASTPVLAAVSPNREMGDCTSAKGKPCAQPHERQHLNNSRQRARQATSEGSSCRLGQNLVPWDNVVRRER